MQWGRCPDLRWQPEDIVKHFGHFALFPSLLQARDAVIFAVLPIWAIGS